MAITWETSAGSLGVVTERYQLDILLQARSSVGHVTFTIIAGSLPRGLRLDEVVDYDSSQSTAHIKGSPVEVTIYTESKFVVRADDGEDIEDRTFKIAVDGSDIPQWVTKEGFLNVGPNNAFYVLDNSYVDFQLEAYDTDQVAGDVLEYYITPMNGELPPGLTLSKTGRIYGYTDPIFAVDYLENFSGAYDAAAFDVTPLDIMQAKSNGFDSYLFDLFDYDYSDMSRTPRRLSRFYTFIVTVSDGKTESKRLFRIYVVTEEFLKADNTIVQVDTNLFQADASSYRVPLWITESNLGRHRANNYITIFLDVYRAPGISGSLVYFVKETNPGIYILNSTGETVTGNYEISGKIPRFSYTFKGNWTPTKNYNVGDTVFYFESGSYTVRGNWDPTISYGNNEAVYYKNELWACIKIPNLNKNPLDYQTYWRKIPYVMWVCQIANSGVTPSLSEYWSVDVDTSSTTFVPTDTNAWSTVSPETASVLPPGMVIDQYTGEIAGRSPYQSAVTKQYKFTISAVNFLLDLAGSEYTLRGDWSSLETYYVNDAVRYQGFIWICIKEHRNNIPGETETYWISSVAVSDKTFTIDIIGEIESSISWITGTDLGVIKPNKPSIISVGAESFMYGKKTVYDLTSGKLPPGLELLSTGNIQGKVKQFADSKGPGLTRFFEYVSDTQDSTDAKSYLATYDSKSTTFDKTFTFEITARDTANFARSPRTFTLKVVEENNKTFANLYITALQSKSKRLDWFKFITDSTIFAPVDIYRYGDVNFGIQSEIKILIFAGIESVEAVKYVQAMSRNHYRKRIIFGDVKSAKAKDPITQETLYEVVYVDVIDSLEKNGKSISQTVQLPDYINSKVLTSYDAIKVDSDIPFVSDSDHQRIFPNSIKNMRKQIRNVGQRDREFLPLWMRSIQNNSAFEPGYVKALPLCYAKPGRAEAIIARINLKTTYASKGEWIPTVDYVAGDTVRYRGNYYTCITDNKNQIPGADVYNWTKNFDFKDIDLEADRYQIDVLDSNFEAKYLAFPQRGEKLP